MADFVFKMVGMKPLQRSMMRRHKGLSSLKKANIQALAIIDRWIQKNFEGEGKLAMGGSGWEPLSARTLLARARGYGDYVKSINPRILQNKGELKKHWKHYATDKYAYIRSTRDYGIHHHKGSKSLPERRIVPTVEQIKPQLRKHYEWFMRNAIR